MLELSPATEALAHDLAAERRVSVDEIVREALEARQRLSPSTIDTTMSPAAIEERQAFIQRIVDEIAALPELDTRSTKEIVDDLNAL